MTLILLVARSLAGQKLVAVTLELVDFELRYCCWIAYLILQVLSFESFSRIFSLLFIIQLLKITYGGRIRNCLDLRNLEPRR